MTGLIYIIIAEFLWATEFVLIRRFFVNHNAFFIMAVASIVGSLFYLPSLFLIKQKVTLVEIGLLILYGFTSWYLAQMVYTKGIQIANNSNAAALLTLTLPLFIVFMSHIFLKETITLRIIIGGIFMIIGFILITIK